MSSLLIVGSCSRITQNVVSLLAKGSHYSSITIADLLPLYHHHERYYALQSQLGAHSSGLAISKLISLNHLSGLVKAHSHVLSITHDYFHNVTSKHKIAEATAQLSKNVPCPRLRKNVWCSQRLSSTTTTATHHPSNTTIRPTSSCGRVPPRPTS